MKSSLTRYDRMLLPGSDRCKCAACGLYFNSSYAFTKHRYGPFAPISEPDTRRCLDVHQLKRRGWTQTDSGHWATPMKGIGKGGTHKAAREATPPPDTGSEK